jgi:hypothetical protein
MREYFSKWNGDTKADYNSYLLNGLNQIYSDSIAFQYEKESDHGLDGNKQNLWNYKIDSMLKKYEPFSKSNFKLYWPSGASDFARNSFDYYLIFHRPKILRIDTE